jgi:hypothetical protein
MLNSRVDLTLLRLDFEFNSPSAVGPAPGAKMKDLANVPQPQTGFEDTQCRSAIAVKIFFIAFLC